MSEVKCQFIMLGNLIAKKQDIESVQIKIDEPTGDCAIVFNFQSGNCEKAIRFEKSDEAYRCLEKIYKALQGEQ